MRDIYIDKVVVHMGVGESGEKLVKAENIMKKMRRKDFNPAVVVDDISEELADVVIYLDMLADSLGIDLGGAVIYKWNKKSDQLDIPLSLYETGVRRTDIEKL